MRARTLLGQTNRFVLIVILLAMPLSVPARQAQQPQPGEKTETLVARWFERWNALDGSAEKTASFLDLYQPDAIHEVNPNERQIGSVYFEGRDAIRKMAEDFTKANTEIAFRIEKTGTGNAQRDAIFILAEGPWGGPGAGVEFVAFYTARANKKRLTYPGAAFFEFVNGKIRYARFYTNRDEVSEVALSQSR
jgi:ketosteroid isomerase-like protein